MLSVAYHLIRRGQPSGLHLVFNLPLSKLYTNSLMSSLNSRAGWRFGGTGNGETTDDDMARNEGKRNTHIRGEGSRRVSMMVGFCLCEPKVTTNLLRADPEPSIYRRRVPRDGGRHRHEDPPV